MTSDPNLLFIIYNPELNTLPVSSLINEAIDPSNTTLFNRLTIKFIEKTDDTVINEYTKNFLNSNITPETDLNNYIKKINNINFSLPTISVENSQYKISLGEPSMVSETDPSYTNFDTIKNNYVSNLTIIQDRMISFPLNSYIDFVTMLNSIPNIKQVLYTDGLNPVDFASKLLSMGVNTETISNFITDMNTYQNKIKIIDPDNIYKRNLPFDILSEYSNSGTDSASLNKVFMNLNSISDEMSEPSAYDSTSSQPAQIGETNPFMRRPPNWMGGMTANKPNYLSINDISGQYYDVSGEYYDTYQQKNEYLAGDGKTPIPANSDIFLDISQTTSSPFVSTYEEIENNQGQDSMLISMLTPTLPSEEPTIIQSIPSVPKFKSLGSTENIKCDDKCKRGMDERLIKEGFENNVKIPNVQLINEQVLEEQNLAEKTHLLLYVWLVITIFVFYVFVICMISENGWNPLANYVLVGILLFSFYYIFKNIF
jgi:hypothetical protein